MSSAPITKAVILAAGMGSGLRERSGELPKPLCPVAQVPLLVRVVSTLRLAGVREVVVVVGCQGDEIRDAMAERSNLGVKVTFVENSRYRAKNGVSLLAAAEHIDGECLLSMADHLYSPDLVRRLVQADVPYGHCALGVDYNIERCFDIDDATKGGVRDGLIADIHKELVSYDALDTGVFRIGPKLIDERRRINDADGDCSLSDGVKALARRGEFHACDVGDARWIDVDTAPAAERAEAMIRLFGETLGEVIGSGAPRPSLEAEAMEMFAPTWVRAAKPYNEDHFAVANERDDVARMMSNESAFTPSARVLRAMLDAATGANLYPTSGRDLKRRLAAREGLEPSSVMLGAGSTELIDVIIRTFVSAGEEVVVSVPTFSMYEARTRVVGGIPVLVPMDEDHEHAVNDIIRAITERTKVIFLCTPNNPTGSNIPEGELRRLLALGLPTVIDEAYYELGSAGSLGHLVSEYPNAILLRTFSKAFGLAGLRLGYALGNQVVIELLSRVKVPWNVPSITQAAAIAALDDTDEFESRVESLKARRDDLAIRLSKISGITAKSTDGNFVLVDVTAAPLPAGALVTELLEREGVLIRSLAAHHATRNFVRVTIGTTEQNSRCVSAFRRVLDRRAARSAPHHAYVALSSDAE